MAESIKGINVVIGAETTGLSRALADVDKRSKSIQSELKQVEKLLKFDPSNVEAVAQKQKLLTEQIEATTERLNRLKDVEKQVQEQFQRGDISETQYRAFRREIEFTQSSLEKLKTELASMEQEQQRVTSSTKQLETLFKAIGKSVDDFADALGDKLTNAIKSGRASADQLDQALEKIGQAALGANVDLDKMRAALRSVDDGNSLANVRKELNALAEEAGEAQKSIKDMGIELENVAGAMLAGGGIAGAVEKALDTSGFKTKIDITFEVPEQSKNAVKDAVRTIQAYGIDAQEALEGVRRQWALNKEATDEVNAAIVKGAAAIATAYNGIDFIELIQETHEIASELNISNENALALVNSLLRIGFPPEQLDIISEYGQQLQRAGYTAQEIQAIFAAGIETGTWNIDNLLDGLKEGRIRLAEFGQEVPEAIQALLEGTNISVQQLQQWGQAVAEGGEKGKQAMVDVALALNGVKDQTTQNALGVQIFGTMWEDQGANITSTLLNMNQHLVSAKDNQDKLNETISKLDSDPAVKMQQAMADLKTALEPVLLVIADMISKIAEWTSNNPTLAATIAAVTTAIGIIIGACTALAPVLTAISTAAATAGVSIGTIVALIGIAVAAIAGLVAGGMALYNHFKQDAIPEVQRFGNEVSESTQKAVGAFLDLNDQATMALNQLSWSGQTVTQEMANNIISTFGQMGDQVLAAMQEDHAKQIQSMQTFFAQSSALTTQEETAALEKMKQGQLERENTVREGQARIAEILNQAASEKRAITDAERAEINRIQQEMVDTGIQVMSENELEQKAILERMRANASELTARQAAEVVQNSVKQRDEAIKAANEQYNNVVKEIIRQRDEVGSITKEQADKLIQEATRQRDEAIKKAQEMHQNIVSEAKAQAGEHVNQVNWETGEVLTRWEVFKNNVKTKWDEMSENIRTSQADIGAKMKAWDPWGDVKSAWETFTTRLREVWDDNVKKAREFGANVMKAIREGIASIEIPLPEIEIEWKEGPKGIKIPDIDIGVSWKSLRSIIPGLAEGGIVTRATLAMIGEAGDKEAVIPLSKLQPMLTDALAEAMKKSGGKSLTIYQTFHSPTPLSPSETARLNLKASRQLAMEWGI